MPPEIETELRSPIRPQGLANRLLLPLAFTLDWWKTAYWLTRRVLPDATGAAAPDDDTAPPDLLGDFQKALHQTLEALKPKAPSFAPGDAAPPAKLGAALTAFLDQAWRTAQAAYAVAQPDSPAPESGSYKRRWRAKS